MSYLERGLMQQVDKIILDADPKELAELQKIDIKTQLDGIWFYDICNLSDQIQRKQDITANKLFSK